MKNKGWLAPAANSLDFLVSLLVLITVVVEFSYFD